MFVFNVELIGKRPGPPHARGLLLGLTFKKAKKMLLKKLYDEEYAMMLQDIARWQEKLVAGSHLGKSFYAQYAPRLPQKIKKIAFVGMGGSGIAGRLVKTLLDKQTSVISIIIEGTYIPGHIDQDTLVMVTSYSGNTWETVEVLKELIKRQIPTIVIAHGGRALELAKAHDIPWIHAPASASPRSALGSFLGILLAFFDACGVLKGDQMLQDFTKHLDHYLATVSSRAHYDDFLKLAAGREFFHIWGVSGDSSACAYRTQTQFNENSKIQAVSLNFPELCHNVIVGFTQTATKPLVLLFYTDFLSQNLKKAVAATEELLLRKGVALYKPPILGDTFERQLFHMVLWADFASCYLGQVNGVDLEPVILIDELKEEHKQKGITV